MKKNETFTLFLLSQLYGYKKTQILDFVCSRLDEDLRFFGTYKDISDATGASKPTIVSLFKDLRNIHLIKKEKNGLYKFNPKIRQDLI